MYKFFRGELRGGTPTGAMPQVHIIGQVLGASGFAQDKLFCKYKVNYDHRSMRLVDGEPEDQTQLSTTNVSSVTERRRWQGLHGVGILNSCRGTKRVRMTICIFAVLSSRCTPHALL